MEEWLQQFGSQYGLARKETIEAFHEMGDDAVAYLVRLALSEPQSTIREQRYEYWTLKLPTPARKVMWFIWKPKDRGRLSEAASEALRELKPAAAVYVPLLEPHLHNTSGWEYKQAIFLLGATGAGAETEAVPHLVKGLHSPDRKTRQLAVQSLEWLGPADRTATPELLAALAKPETRTRAATALGNIGPEAAMAVPQLQSILATSDHMAIAVALQKVKPDETEGLKRILDRLNSGDLEAAHAIARLGGEPAKAAIPRLLEILGEEDVDRWTSAADVLRKIMSNNTNALNVIRAKLMHDPQDINAVAWLLRMDPNEPNGVKATIECLQSGTAEDKFFIIYVLTNELPTESIGAVAPALRSLSKSSDRSLRDAAATALRRIE